MLLSTILGVVLVVAQPVQTQAPAQVAPNARAATALSSVAEKPLTMGPSHRADQVHFDDEGKMHARVDYRSEPSRADGTLGRIVSGTLIAPALQPGAQWVLEGELGDGVLRADVVGCPTDVQVIVSGSAGPLARLFPTSSGYALQLPGGADEKPVEFRNVGRRVNGTQQLFFSTSDKPTRDDPTFAITFHANNSLSASKSYSVQVLRLGSLTAEQIRSLRAAVPMMLPLMAHHPLAPAERPTQDDVAEQVALLRGEPPELFAARMPIADARCMQKN